MKRIIVASSLFFLAISLVAAVDNKVSEKEKLEKIQQELEENRTKLNQTRQQQSEVLTKLVKINQELRQANRKLNRAKEKIKTNQEKIGQLVVELSQTQQDLDAKSTTLIKRVREAYKSGGVSQLDLLLTSQSMSDFLNRLYFFEKLVERDAKLIQAVKSDLQETKSEKTFLANRNEEIKELAEVINEEKQKIAVNAEEKKKTFEALKEREEEYEKKIAELEKSSQELEVLIQAKIAQRSRAGIYARSTGKMIWPLLGRITSRYGSYRRYMRGHFHTGLDIAAQYGSPILAADSGEVIFSGWWDGYGKAIVIDHGRGLATVYAHLSRIYVSVGRAVSKGQTIGLEGSTGYSTGPHLHFEIRKNGRPVNPTKYLP